MGPAELVVGLEVLQSLVKISLWRAFRPSGLLEWLQGRFGMRRTTWLWLRKKNERGLGFILNHSRGQSMCP